MVSVTVFVPDVVYIIPVGFSEVDVAGIAPEPKFQKYDQLPPVLPVLVKFTAVFAHCGALLVNVAVGVRLIVMVLFEVTAQPDAELVMVSVITFVPAVE